MNPYSAVLMKYAVFSGRARRSEYWVWILINVIIGFVLSIIDVFIWRGGNAPLSFSYRLVVLLPTICVTCRRLHDTGRSGWWGLPVFIGLISSVVPRSVQVHISTLALPPSLNVASSIIIVLLVFIYLPALGLLIYYLVSDSKPGPNKYGPYPKDVRTVPAS